MSALAVAVKAASKAPGGVCSIQRVFGAIDNLDDTETLAALLADPSVTGAAIARGLTAIGYPIRSQTVTRHRNGDCACP